MQDIVERVLRENMRTATGSGLNIRYYSWTQINFDKDFTAVISVSDCASTWQTFESVRRERLVYIALTEAGCARLPSDEAIMVPIIGVGAELPQILLDARAAQAIAWKSSVLLYDETFGELRITNCIMQKRKTNKNRPHINRPRSRRHQSRDQVAVLRVTPQQCCHEHIPL